VIKSTSQRPPYTVLRATVRSLRLLRLVRFQTGHYGVLDGDSALYIESADPAGRRRAVTAFESVAATIPEPIDFPHEEMKHAI
jgi:hypothetical protein